MTDVVTGARRAHRHRSFRRLVRSWPLWPALIFLAVLFLFPISGVLSASFQDANGHLSLVNYLRLLHTPVYLRVLANTLSVSALTALVAVTFGYPVAYYLATASAERRQVVTLFVLLPFWSGFLVRTFAWLILLGYHGPINRLLEAIGLISRPLPLINNLLAVLIGMGHAMMPMAILTMLAVMQDIDPNLRKAASTLGGRGGQTFWRIYFPLSLPGVVASGILVFISALGFFITPAILGSPTNTMLAQVIITEVLEFANWGFGGALAVVLFVASLLVFLVYDRLLGSALGRERAMARHAGRGGVLRVAGCIGRAIVGGLGDLCATAGRGWDRVVARHAERQSHRFSGKILTAITLTTVAFLALPSLFIIPVSFTGGQFLEFPPQGISLRWFEEFFQSDAWIAATIRSFGVAILTAVLALVLGAGAAFVLVRQRVPGAAAMLAFILAPLIIPRIAVAVALFFFFARFGMAATNTALVLGHVVIALPYVVITTMAILRNYDSRLDYAAWSLGASRSKTLRHVTVPVIKGGLAAAAIFAFVTSFDDLNIALFVSGGLINTLPSQMWSSLVLQASPVLGASSTVILLGVTAAIVIAELVRRSGSNLGARERSAA